jgi:small redox-active disulfide protein 2
MKIQILGTGCTKCVDLYDAAMQAVQQANANATVEKVTDIVAILEFAPWALPALAVNGQVKAAGQVLTPEQIRAFFPTTGG